jgi:hypothetical protein
MQEKAMFNPDTRPRALTLVIPWESQGGPASPRLPTKSDKTPAEASRDSYDESMTKEPKQHHYKMPEVNLGSSIVTAMPVTENTGGALDTVSKGETVVPVPGSDVTEVSLHHPHEEPSAVKDDETLSPGDLAVKLRDTAVFDRAPPGATVLHGQKDREDERAAAPAGSADDTGHTVGDKVRSDFVTEKVGMVDKELTAADMYATSESGPAPVSTFYKGQGGDDACDICACNPCQCDKYTHARNYPLELTPPETKRAGKPAIHHPHRGVTGENAHEAHDYRGHAKQVSEQHARVGARVGDFEGNVPKGKGEWSDVDPSNIGSVAKGTHAGGAVIMEGNSDDRQGIGRKAGGVKGGRTEFTTLG